MGDNQNVSREQLLDVFERLLEESNTEGYSQTERILLKEIEALKLEVMKVSQDKADVDLKIGVLTERLSGFMTLYNDLKEDVDELQEKDLESASSSKKFREQIMLLVIGGIVSYIGNLLLSK